jgi:DNA-binding MarR family transcriptional regulator
MNKKLLKCKDLSPSQKLILMLIEDNNPLIAFNLTSQEIANELGLKRKQVLEDLDILQENGLIECQVEYRIRKTTLTELYKENFKDQ